MLPSQIQAYGEKNGNNCSDPSVVTARLKAVALSHKFTEFPGNNEIAHNHDGDQSMQYFLGAEEEIAIKVSQDAAQELRLRGGHGRSFTRKINV